MEKLEKSLDIIALNNLLVNDNVSPEIKKIISAGVEVYKNLTITDGLTNLYNRRYFDDSLSKEMARSTRHDNSFSLIMLDVDNFKNYNDTYGHPEGDEVLKDIGSIIKSSIRKIDVPCRYGGEEFAVILPETTKDNAVILAERIRERLVEKRFFPPRE